MGWLTDRPKAKPPYDQGDYPKWRLIAAISSSIGTGLVKWTSAPALRACTLYTEPLSSVVLPSILSVPLRGFSTPAPGASPLAFSAGDTHSIARTGRPAHDAAKAAIKSAATKMRAIPTKPHPYSMVYLPFLGILDCPMLHHHVTMKGLEPG